MEARNVARKSGNKNQYKNLRNIVNKLVKRDKIQGTLSRLGSNPCPSKAWQEANRYLGKGHSSMLPECTNNSDPNLTAENQNSYFVNKIEQLVNSIPTTVPSSMSPVTEQAVSKITLKSWASDIKAPVSTQNECGSATPLPTAVKNVIPEEIAKNDNVTQLPQAVKNGHSEEILHSGSATPLPTAVKNGIPEEISKNDNVTQLPQAVENGHPEEILHSGSETPLPTAVKNEGKKPFECNSCDTKYGVEFRKKFAFKFVTASTVTKLISRLNNTKALGVDNLPTDVWKKGVISLAGPIARLCNLSLASGIVPDMFKKAIVIPVYKGHGKSKNDPGSYRPISILPAISKILEMAVRDDLLEWFDHSGFLPDSQFGFLPSRSSDMALTIAQTDWIKAKEDGYFVGVMAFDLFAASDTIDHSISWVKPFQIPVSLNLWTVSFFVNCTLYL